MQGLDNVFSSNIRLATHNSGESVLGPREEYARQLGLAMGMLSLRSRSVFMGQAVRVKGTAMSATLDSVPMSQRIELPVFEDVQLGIAIGAALRGDLPICIYPRWNFLLCAMNQLMLHLDKLPLYSDYVPKVIIRTAIATDHPMDPGVQHLGDFSASVDSMLKTVNVVRLDTAEQIVPEYERAVGLKYSTILVERSEFYA